MDKLYKLAQELNEQYNMEAEYSTSYSDYMDGYLDGLDYSIGCILDIIDKENEVEND